jgi:fatty acid desaturase
MSSTPKFSFAEARSLIRDLSIHNPLIYWCDFLVSIVVGHLAINAMVFLPRWYPEASGLLPVLIGCYVLTVVAYMRALMFIHELVHLPKGKFMGFRFAWNALCGILFLVPSFLYYPHVDHHRRKSYGTAHDGEYLAFSHSSRWLIVGFILQSFVIPFIAIARFLLISPLCWLIPGLRPWIHRHASTMLVDPSYQRNDASPNLMRTVVIQELLCFLWLIVLICRHYWTTGVWFDPFWLVAYAVAVGLLVLNAVRTLGAHRWNNRSEGMTFEEQLLDTVNYPDRPWFTELWGPIGTRYHALHHLFPSLPYHNLGAAHRRLVEGLPPDSIYHQTYAKSLFAEIVALWRRARRKHAPESAAGANVTLA